VVGAEVGRRDVRERRPAGRRRGPVCHLRDEHLEPARGHLEQRLLVRDPVAPRVPFERACHLAGDVRLPVVGPDVQEPVDGAVDQPRGDLPGSDRHHLARSETDLAGQPEDQAFPVGARRRPERLVALPFEARPVGIPRASVRHASPNRTSPK
jgi:hypothetical protein